MEGRRAHIVEKGRGTKFSQGTPPAAEDNQTSQSPTIFMITELNTCRL